MNQSPRSSKEQKTDSTQSSSLRLMRIEIDNLFGLYNHVINLHLHEQVTIIHGPNGIGKTVLLRMIDALFKGRLSHFRQILFSRFFAQFHDGSSLMINKTITASQEGWFELVLTTDEIRESTRIHSKSEAEYIAAKIHYLRPHETLSNTWIDIRDGEILSSDEVRSRFQGRVQVDSYPDIPWFSAFLKKTNSYVIQEQRLFQVARKEPDPQMRFWSDDRSGFVSTVIQYSEDFRDRLAQAMANYGRQSQILDQSFPQRLISAQKEMSLNEIQNGMSELEERTTDLMQMGILEETPIHPFQAGALERIDPTEARVMTLYVSDTKSKLAALDSLADRSRLLLNIVNKKYRHKHVRVDRERGLVAESDSSDVLALDSLSSGEQHELVLHYDLLFGVLRNTIVLIDEPELSLHVAWQKRFLPDLMDIVKLSGVDALIATHSPYIIGDRADLLVDLKDSQ